ncbi:MAG: hypothetical protein Q9178_007824 [Gyalolechia marmorata]
MSDNSGAFMNEWDLTHSPEGYECFLQSVGTNSTDFWPNNAPSSLSDPSLPANVTPQTSPDKTGSKRKNDGADAEERKTPATKRQRLTKEEKSANHIRSEKKRIDGHQEIRVGMCKLIPELGGDPQGNSKKEALVYEEAKRVLEERNREKSALLAQIRAMGIDPWQVLGISDGLAPPLQPSTRS